MAKKSRNGAHQEVRACTAPPAPAVGFFTFPPYPSPPRDFRRMAGFPAPFVPPTGGIRGMENRG